MIYSIKIEYQNITTNKVENLPIFFYIQTNKQTLKENIKTTLKNTEGLWRNEIATIEEFCKTFNKTIKIIGYGIEPSNIRPHNEIKVDITHQLINNISFNKFLTT